MRGEIRKERPGAPPRPKRSGASVEALHRGVDVLRLHLDGVEVDADALAVYDEGELAGFELAGQEPVRGAVLQGLESLDDAVYEINGFDHTSILSGGTTRLRSGQPQRRCGRKDTVPQRRPEDAKDSNLGEMLASRYLL